MWVFSSIEKAHEKTHRAATVGFWLLNLNWLAPAGD